MVGAADVYVYGFDGCVNHESVFDVICTYTLSCNRKQPSSMCIQKYKWPVLSTETTIAMTSHL